jgi:hypothetical protein
MSGQNRKDPFHVNRDVVRDNLTVVRKLRLPRGAQIRARRMYATADSSGGVATVSMPYTGHLNLTVTAGGNDIIVNNPFVTSQTYLSISSGSPGSVSYTNPGQFTLSGLAAGNYVINVGRPTNPRVTRGGGTNNAQFSH